MQCAPATFSVVGQHDKLIFGQKRAKRTQLLQQDFAVRIALEIGTQHLLLSSDHARSLTVVATSLSIPTWEMLDADSNPSITRPGSSSPTTASSPTLLPSAETLRATLPRPQPFFGALYTYHWHRRFG